MKVNPYIESALFSENDLDINDLSQLFAVFSNKNIDDADLYIQHVMTESWVLENGVIKEANFDIDCGAGIQVFSELSHVNTYTQQLSMASLQHAAQTAGSIFQYNSGISIVNVDPSYVGDDRLYSQTINPLNSMTDDDKKKMLLAGHLYARKLSTDIKQIQISLSGQVEAILIMGIDGRFATDLRPLVRLDVSVVLEKNGGFESGYSGGGGRYDYHELDRQGFMNKAVSEAIRCAELNFTAEPAPAGTMQVVLAPGWTGVLLHEAVGHGLEGDFIRKKTSSFTNLMGEVVASPQCSVVDDATLPYQRGSLNVDDEGTAGACTDLIQDGKVTGFMYDRLNARVMGVRSTGNGRRQSYQHPVMPRMTNTFMRAGQYSQSEMIEHVESGIFAVNFGGGQVDITSGQFVFSATEAYKIEQGKITVPIKGATLVGNGLEVLKKIVMIGNDLEHDKGVGTCGKDGQSVPVGVGQPSLLLEGMVVGGTDV